MPLSRLHTLYPGPTRRKRQTPATVNLAFRLREAGPVTLSTFRAAFLLVTSVMAFAFLNAGLRQTVKWTKGELCQ